jgi:hypothetical protein
MKAAVRVPQQFRTEVSVAAAEQQRPLPDGAVGALELALPTHPDPEPPEYDVDTKMVTT